MQFLFLTQDPTNRNIKEFCSTIKIELLGIFQILSDNFKNQVYMPDMNERWGLLHILYPNDAVKLRCSSTTK